MPLADAMKKQHYQQKHSLYQIFRIMTTMLSRDGPLELNLKEAVDYCHTVDNSNHEIFTNVIDADLPNFLEAYSKTFACPIIYYKGQVSYSKLHHCLKIFVFDKGDWSNHTSQDKNVQAISYLLADCKQLFPCHTGRCDNDTVAVMRKLIKFLQANGLNNKLLITFNFPADSDELLKCKASGLFPNNVIKVIPKEPHIPAKKSENLVETYFKNNIASFTLTDDVQENCCRLKNAIDKYAYTSNLNLDSGFHLQRIIFLGQIGSGRKTQARLLAKRWHLVFLDFRVLLLEYAKLNKCFDDFLMKVRSAHRLNRKLMASILFERITKRDCLENGWILVGYVSSVTDLKVMESQFHIIPNKIMFIHCRQHLCLDRLRNRIIKKAEINELRYSEKDIKYAKLGFLDLFSPCCAINHIMTEMDHFCRKRPEILKYCQDHAKYIAHIDGEHSVSTVTTLLSGQLEKLNF